jgi:hypothetical protein
MNSKAILKYKLIIKTVNLYMDLTDKIKLTIKIKYN